MLLFLGVASILTAIISAIIGMVGGVTLLAVMTAVLPWAIAIPIHGLTQLTSNTSRAILLRKHIRKNIAGSFVIGVPFGAVMAIPLIKLLQDSIYPSLLILGLITYVLLKPKKLPPLKIPIWAFGLVGVIAGFLSLLIGATGPFLAPFFLRDDLNKNQIISTSATAQVVTHAIKIPSFLYLDFNYLEHLNLLIILMIGTVIGTNLGLRILSRINENVFRYLYQGALFLAALRILYNLGSS